MTPRAETAIIVALARCGLGANPTPAVRHQIKRLVDCWTDAGRHDAAARLDAVLGPPPPDAYAARIVQSPAPAAGGPSVAEQFAALGWDFASIVDAAAELERLSGMVRANVASRIAAENERDDAVRGYRWTASGGPGVGREEEYLPHGPVRLALYHAWLHFEVQHDRHAEMGRHRAAEDARRDATVVDALMSGTHPEFAIVRRSPAGPPRETGSEDTDAVIGQAARALGQYAHVLQADGRLRVADDVRALSERLTSRAPGAASRDTTTGDA